MINGWILSTNLKGLNTVPHGKIISTLINAKGIVF